MEKEEIIILGFMLFSGRGLLSMINLEEEEFWFL
jgi:hypothetical protein